MKEKNLKVKWNLKLVRRLGKKLSKMIKPSQLRKKPLLTLTTTRIWTIRRTMSQFKKTTRQLRIKMKLLSRLRTGQRVKTKKTILNQRRLLMARQMMKKTKLPRTRKTKSRMKKLTKMKATQMVRMVSKGLMRLKMTSKMMMRMKDPNQKAHLRQKDSHLLTNLHQSRAYQQKQSQQHKMGILKMQVKEDPKRKYNHSKTRQIQAKTEWPKTSDLIFWCIFLPSHS